MPLSSTKALKQKNEVLCVPLDFAKDLTIDALVDSGAYVSPIARKVLNINKQQASANIFKIVDPLNFQIQVAIGQLEEPIATVTLKIDIRDHTFVEYFVVTKNLTRAIIS